MKSWIDPPAKKISYDERGSEFNKIPQGIKNSCHYLEGTSQETPYLNTPVCFAELDGDSRLRHLDFDNSLAALRLWSFLLSEEERLHRSRKAGKKIIGTLKDLGTASIIAYSAEDAVAFYPDGAWWLPCLMEMSENLLRIADSVGFGNEACPARAALAAFINQAHFPMPDLLINAVGSCCDDFSAIMQRISDHNIPVTWWELPYRRIDDTSELFKTTLTGIPVASRLVDFVADELNKVRESIEKTVSHKITESMLADGIQQANKLRSILAEIRDLSYSSIPAPFPALETQICEMLSLHYCSDRQESIRVLQHVLETIKARTKKKEGVLPNDSCRCVWVNPVADLRVMNLFEDLGGSLAGTEYLFRHALIQIPTDMPPLKALAMTALCDPMIGPASYRAQLVREEAEKYNAEGVIISSIPGASHCATEHLIIKEEVGKQAGLPVLEISVHPLTDSTIGQLTTQLEAFFEIIRSRKVT